MEFAVFIVFWLVARATLLTPNTLKYVGALQKRGDPDEFYVNQAALFRALSMLFMASDVHALTKSKFITAVVFLPLVLLVYTLERKALFSEVR